MLFSFIVLLCAIILVGVVSANISRANTLCFVICFFEAVLGGWIVTNGIRLIIITLLARMIVRNEEENQGKARGCADTLDCLFVPDEAKEMVEDM